MNASIDLSHRSAPHRQVVVLFVSSFICTAPGVKNRKYHTIAWRQASADHNIPYGLSLSLSESLPRPVTISASSCGQHVSAPPLSPWHHTPCRLAFVPCHTFAPQTLLHCIQRRHMVRPSCSPGQRILCLLQTRVSDEAAAWLPCRLLADTTTTTVHRPPCSPHLCRVRYPHCTHHATVPPPCHHHNHAIHWQSLEGRHQRGHRGVAWQGEADSVVEAVETRGEVTVSAASLSNSCWIW